MNTNKRKIYLDTLKFISIFLVFLGHFTVDFNAGYFDFANTIPMKFFVSGITAKLGVAFFAIILGYLSFQKRDESFFKYVIRRYAYFFFVGFFINTIYFFIYDISFIEVFKTSIKLSKGIFGHFWFLRYFFIASTISYFLAKNDASIFERLFFIMLLYYVGFNWSGLCLFGTFINDLKELKIFKNKYFKVLLFIISFLSIQIPESELSYILGGIFAVIVICIIENTPAINKLLSRKVGSLFGSKTLAILIIHQIVYKPIATFLFTNYFDLNGISFLVVMLICFIIICVISLPVTFIFDYYNKFVYFVLNKFEIIMKNHFHFK